MLNPSQQRYLTAVLAEVEKHLAGIEAAAIPDVTFSETECSELRCFATKTRVELAKLADEFTRLPDQDPIASRWQVHTRLEFALVEFLELTARKLRGYGEVNDETFAQLKARLAPLQSDLEALLRKY